jgi:hypothetical protein
VLVASTRNFCLLASYSARVILTVSVDGGGGGGAFTVKVALRVMPLRVAVIATLLAAVTVVVLILKLAEDAPATTVTLAGKVAAALLLARLTTVATEAVALRMTVPWAEFPPVTAPGFMVNADSVIALGGGGGGVTVRVTEREPSWLLATVMVTF